LDQKFRIPGKLVSGLIVIFWKLQSYLVSGLSKSSCSVIHFEKSIVCPQMHSVGGGVEVRGGSVIIVSRGRHVR
jgi:hypothetical protein